MRLEEALKASKVGEVSGMRSATTRRPNGSAFLVTEANDGTRVAFRLSRGGKFERVRVESIKSTDWTPGAALAPEPRLRSLPCHLCGFKVERAVEVKVATCEACRLRECDPGEFGIVNEGPVMAPPDVEVEERERIAREDSDA